MSQHAIQCLIIQQSGSRQSSLEAALRGSYFKPVYQHVNNSAELHRGLGRLPALLFCPARMSLTRRKKLYSLLYKIAPDCIVAYYSDNQWSGLALTSGGITTCTLTAGRPAELRRQLDYLLAYASMKSEFRHCKHLLSIVEQRNQWLVEYSREAVAYVFRNQHLYVNAAYMHLFGFDSQLGALNAPVSQLVSPAHHEAFLSLSQETEQRAFLPNKFLLRMRSSKRAGGLFRAEVRFIPAVFHGQRCIQLHVHPLLDVTASGEKKSTPTAPDPWKVRVPVVAKPVAEKPEKSLNRAVNKVVGIPEKPLSGARQAPVVSGQRAGVNAANAGRAKTSNTLKVSFGELLNLKGSDNPAMFITRPHLKKPGESISKNLLLSNLDTRVRQAVDEKCLESAVNYLHQRFEHPLKHWVWVELEDWVFTDKSGLRGLLDFLKQHEKIVSSLVISVKVNSCIRLRESAIRVFSLLQATGVRIALDGVRQLTPEVSAILEISRAILVRTHPDLLEPVKASGVINDELNQILQLKSAYVVIDGVGDVNIMNLLCETNAGYLQGEVLDKFARKV